MTKFPIIQDSIIAKNTRGFDVSEGINIFNITYTCIYNEVGMEILMDMEKDVFSKILYLQI